MTEEAVKSKGPLIYHYSRPSNEGDEDSSKDGDSGIEDDSASSTSSASSSRAKAAALE